VVVDAAPEFVAPDVVVVAVVAPAVAPAELSVVEVDAAAGALC